MSFDLDLGQPGNRRPAPSVSGERPGVDDHAVGSVGERHGRAPAEAGLQAVGRQPRMPASVSASLYLPMASSISGCGRSPRSLSTVAFTSTIRYASSRLPVATGRAGLIQERRTGLWKPTSPRRIPPARRVRLAVSSTASRSARGDRRGSLRPSACSGSPHRDRRRRTCPPRRIVQRYHRVASGICPSSAACRGSAGLLLVSWAFVGAGKRTEHRMNPGRRNPPVGLDPLDRPVQRHVLQFEVGRQPTRFRSSSVGVTSEARPRSAGRPDAARLLRPCARTRRAPISSS